MVLTLRKKVVAGVFATVILCSSSNTYTSRDNTAANVAAGCVIGAGILGLVGAVTAGIYYLCNKSDEQVLQDAKDSLRLARSYGTRFRSVYSGVFERAHYSEPSLDDIELNFLLPIATEAIKTNFSPTAHVEGVASAVSSLHDRLAQVAERIQKLERDYTTYGAIYQELCVVRSDIRQALAYLEGYSAQLTAHKAFFELYAYESKLCGVYSHELQIGRDYQHDPYLFERYILQGVGMHGSCSEYPLIAYHARLVDHIDQLDRYTKKLRYYYPSRTPLAQQLLGYLRYVRGVIEVTSAFKEEKRLKKEADDRAEWLAYQARQAAALEANAYAARVEADAQRVRAQAERERNRIEREKYGIAPVNSTTISLTFPG